MDPTGQGDRTPEAREKWWDDHYEAEFYYAMNASFVSGNQVVNYESLIMVGEVDGQKLSFKCEGIWTYEVDSRGKLTAMIGDWEEEALMESRTPLPDHQFIGLNCRAVESVSPPAANDLGIEHLFIL